MECYPDEHHHHRRNSPAVSLLPSDRSWDFMLALAHRSAERIMATSPGLTRAEMHAAYRSLVKRPGGHDTLRWWLDIVDRAARVVADRDSD